jgi:hypothetical protein
MSDPKPPPVLQSNDPILSLQVTPGLIEYTDSQKKPQKFYFQCNPTSLSRSRTINRTDSPATNQAAGTKTAVGDAGRKYTLKANAWRLDTLELWFDASMPHYLNGTRSETGGLDAVQQSIKHIEAISEPGPVRSQNASQTGAPPLPSPPLITLTLGTRIWQGHVSSVSIVEQDFTYDLVPRRVKVTLGIEPVVTEAQLQQGKIGAKK